MNTTPPRANEFWFLNTLVAIRVSSSDGQDGVSVIDHRVSQGDASPLHIHRTEDEIFQILEGEFRVKVGGDELVLGPGAIALAPKGVPHCYRAESAGGGRFLTVTAHGDFERFVRAMGHPPERPGLPDQVAPTPELIQALTATAAQHGIEIIGPPLA